MKTKVIAILMLVCLAGVASAVTYDWPSELVHIIEDEPVSLQFNIDAGDYEVAVDMRANDELLPFISGMSNTHLPPRTSGEFNLIINPSLPDGMHKLIVTATDLSGSDIQFNHKSTYTIVKGSVVDLRTEFRNPNKLVVIVNNYGDELIDDKLSVLSSIELKDRSIRILPGESDEFEYFLPLGFYDVRVLLDSFEHTNNIRVGTPNLNLIDVYPWKNGVRLDLSLDWNSELSSKMIVGINGVQQVKDITLDPGDNRINLDFGRPMETSESANVIFQTPLRTFHFKVELSGGVGVQGFVVKDVLPDLPVYYAFSILAVILLYLGFIFIRSRNKGREPDLDSLLKECDKIVRDCKGRKRRKR